MATKFRYLRFGMGEPATCFWCQIKTDYILKFPNGDEIFCCPVHALRFGKIRRISRYLKNYPQNKKSTKFSENPLVKISNFRFEEATG